jgi:hypothetical protein
MENTTIAIVDVVGNSACIEAEEGQKVFELIESVISEGRTVTLSFLNVEMLAADFLSTAIGQLYKDFSVNFIKENVKIEDLSLTGAVSLKRVVDNAKLNYIEPQAK